MTSEELELVKDLAYTNRWHISAKWGDPEYAEQAKSVADQIVAIATGQNAPIEPPTTPEPTPPPESGPYEPPPMLYNSSYFPVVGYGFTASEFVTYLEWLKDERWNWEPSGITAHHTAAPNLDQRPDGFQTQHMKNLRSYYKDSLGWSRGPHLFVDDHLIWVFSPLTDRGIHAKSFNSSRIGVEMLGEFDYNDDPDSGRGRKVVELSQFAISAMMLVLGIDKDRLNFHRHDPSTSKTCPGKKVDFKTFESAVHQILAEISA